MRVKRIAAVLTAVLMLFPAQGFTRAISGWDGVMDGMKVLNIYIEKVSNESGDKAVDVDKVTGIVREVFSTRGTPCFTIVDDITKADIVFKGSVSEFLWMEKAPITNVYGAGALAMDVATHDNKNYARMQLSYRIYEPSSGDTLLDQVTQVTLKQPGIPKDESYKMIYERTPKILVLDIFKRYKKVH